MRERSVADDLVQEAYNKTLLGIILPDMQKTATLLGYNLVMDDDLRRKIDVVATPQGLSLHNPERLVNDMIFVITQNGVWCVKDPYSGFEYKDNERLLIHLVLWCGNSKAVINFHILPVPFEETSCGEIVNITAFIRRWLSCFSLSGM